MHTIAATHNQQTLPLLELQDLNLKPMNNRRRGIRGVKLDIPHFESNNPAPWIFKVNQYFIKHQFLKDFSWVLTT